MTIVYKTLLNELQNAGLSKYLSLEIIGSISKDIDYISNDFYNKTLTTRLNKVSKAIRTTLTKVN